MKHFEIKILGISGIENLKEMQCIVLIDGNSPIVYSLKDTEFPLFSIAVRNSGSLQITVRHLTSNEVIGTAYFSIHMLPQHRKVWVPLNSGEHKDSCKEYSNRRICLYSTVDFDLSSVAEQSSPDSPFISQMDQLDLSSACLEINENYKNIATSLSGKNKILRLKVLQLEKALEDVVGDKNTENQENPLEKEVEKMNCLMGNLSTLNKDLQKQAGSYEVLYKVEKYQREHLEKQVGSLAKQIDELITAQSDRESELIHEISDRDKQNTAMQTELNALQDQKRVLQLELISWKERASLSSTKTDPDIENRLSILTRNFEESEFQRKLLQEKLEMSHHEDLKQKIILLENELRIAKSECHRLPNPAKPKEIDRKRNLTKHKQEIEDSKKTSEKHIEEPRLFKPGLALPRAKSSRDRCYSPDELFIYHLKKHRLEGLFERITRGVYKFGNKKVSVAIKNDSLICRVSGDFMNIDFFISKYSSAGEKSSHRRLASVIPPAKTEIQMKEKPQRSRTMDLIKNRPRTVKGKEEESLQATQTIDTEQGIVYHSIEASACSNINKLIHDTVSSLKMKLKDITYTPLSRSRSSTCLLWNNK